MKLELINLYKIKTYVGKDLYFTDQQKAHNFAKGKGEYGGNLNVYSEQVLIVNGVQYFSVTSLDSKELKMAIDRAKVIEKLSDDELRVLGLI